MSLLFRSASSRTNLLPKEVLVSCFAAIYSHASAHRAFSVLNRPPPNYPGHVPLTKVERLGLAVGSAVGSLWDVRRHGKYSLS